MGLKGLELVSKLRATPVTYPDVDGHEEGFCVKMVEGVLSVWKHSTPLFSHPRGWGQVAHEGSLWGWMRCDPEVYRCRRVVEGGMKTRLGRAYLWERKPWMAMARAFSELIAYGLKVLLSLLPPPPGYKAIY